MFNRTVADSKGMMNGIYVGAISDQLQSISFLYHYDVAELGKRHTATNHTVRILGTDMGHAVRNLTADQTEDCGARCGGTVTETGIVPYCHDTCPNTGDDGLSGVRFNITLVHQPQPCNNPACIADKRQCFMYVLCQYAVTYLLQSRDAFHVGHGSYMVTVPFRRVN